MYTTRATQHIRAPRSAVYRALLDADAVVQWRVPDGMTGHVHEFDAREGGTYRVSLIYIAPNATGKSGPHTDTYRGRFVSLIPDERVVESTEFETDDPAMWGSMTMTTTLSDAEDGTEVEIVHEGVPDAISPGDNEAGTRMALARLAAFVEART